MTDKELRRLSRSELLEMLITQTKENERLKASLEQAEIQLQSRKIAIDKAGSIAEAALALNGIFQAAENAAQQYLENVQQLSSQQDMICRNMQMAAEKKASDIIQEAETYSQRIHAEADSYWKQVKDRASSILQSQDALREFVLSAGKNEGK